MTHPLVARLAAGPVLADGACGTMLYEAGVALEDCFDGLNLTRPEVVAGVHRAYIAAGADLIETNTFGANRAKLDAFGLAGKVREINRRAVKIAREEREISGKPVLVAGSVGPTMRTLAPIGTTPRSEVRDIYAEQIEALLEGGVDLLIVETVGSLEEMTAALEAARAACDLPVVALMTFAEDGRTLSGDSPREVVDRLRPFAVAALGANCSVGPQRILPVVRAMRRRLLDEPADGAPALACMPNAGWPSHVGGRVIYRSSPEYFADFAVQAAEAGIGLVGGCCGTTPAHVKAMREALDRLTVKPGPNGARPDGATESPGDGAETARSRVYVAPSGADLVAP
jgi:homocysteine S-methyltransferase